MAEENFYRCFWVEDIAMEFPPISGKINGLFSVSLLLLDPLRKDWRSGTLKELGQEIEYCQEKVFLHRVLALSPKHFDL